jgi:hypothetical protein
LWKQGWKHFAMDQVTFEDFAKLATRRHWTPESLAKRFRGVIENPSEFFHRVFEPKNAAAIIPYRSVIAFYSQEQSAHRVLVGKHCLCACGCGQAVFDRKKWAGSACKKRAQRNVEHRAAWDMEKGLCEVFDFIDARPGHFGLIAMMVLTGDLRRDNRGPG